MTELLDARGVPIAPGDVVIYGFGVGRSVAMAEGRVLAEVTDPGDTPLVSLTPMGRVRVRITRRSYASGSKPVVDVAPDRLVVLKPGAYTGRHGVGDTSPYLPPSPLPTQEEKHRQQIANLMEMYKADLQATEVPDRHYYDGWTLARFHAFAAERLKELRAELRKLDD